MLKEVYQQSSKQSRLDADSTIDNKENLLDYSLLSSSNVNRTHLLNQSLADIEIPECQQEDTELPEVKQITKEKSRLSEYHKMLKAYYDPTQSSTLK
jgi:hypothetical protein